MLTSGINNKIYYKTPSPRKATVILGHGLLKVATSCFVSLRYHPRKGHRPRSLGRPAFCAGRHRPGVLPGSNLPVTFGECFGTPSLAGGAREERFLHRPRMGMIPWMVFKQALATHGVNFGTIA